MGNIANFIDKIKHAIYGKDVRQSICDAIEQTYEDAIAHGHTDMEVVQARKNYDNLNARLNMENSNVNSAIETEKNNRINADNNMQNQINGNTSRINENTSRINQICLLPEGSTTGDAELIDIRIDDDGCTHQNAGNSIRDSIANVKNDLVNLNTNYVDWEQGRYRNNDSYPENVETSIRFLALIPEYIKVIRALQGVKFCLHRWSKSSNRFVDRLFWLTDYTLNHDEYFYYLYLANNNDSTAMNLENDWNKVIFYGVKDLVRDFNKNKNYLNKLEKNPRIVETDEMYDLSKWTPAIYNNRGEIESKSTCCLYTEYIPHNIKRIETGIRTKFVLIKFDKNGNFISRSDWLNELNLNSQNYSNYEYKIYVSAITERGKACNKYILEDVKFYADNDLYVSRNCNNISIDYRFDESTNANYTVLRIFKQKIDGNFQFPFVYTDMNASDTASKSTPLDIANKNDWLITINSGLGWTGIGIDGILIQNGQIIKNVPADYHAGAMPLTIDRNGNLGYADTNVDAQDLINQGIVSACCGFCPIIIDYHAVEEFPTVSHVSHFNQNAQRQIIGQFGNGDYAIITCEGRNYQNSDGWTLREAQQICLQLGLKFAYNLDGGGSTATCLGKKQVNTIYENQTGRKVPSFIIFNGKDEFSEV